MKRFSCLFLFYFIFFSNVVYCYNIFQTPQEVISSTYLTQDISIQYNPDVDVLTSKDIKLLGVENLPDLLSYFSGINVYRINSSTATIDVRGYSEIFDSAPKILIDGRETEDQFVRKSYLYNMPITIDDIDRIEIVKGTSFYNNGYDSPAGIINIVTRSPDELDSNYVKVTKGSNDLKKLSFSINKYLAKTYFKFTGSIRAIDDYNTTKESNKHKYLELSISKYIGDNSLLFVKAFTTEGKGIFNDRFTFKIMNRPFFLPYNLYTTDIIGRNIFISYKYPSLEISFLYNHYKGKVDAKVENVTEQFAVGKAKADFYKFNIKKSFKYKFNDFIFGLEERYQDYTYFFENPKVHNFTIYLKDKIKIKENLTLRWLIKNNTVTNYGNNFSYYVNGIIHSKDKNYGISLSYSKSMKIPRSAYKYFNFKANISQYKDIFPVWIPLKYMLVEKNKDLRPLKIYSSELKLFMKKDKLNFKTTFFYNRINDIVCYIGKIEFFKSRISFFPKNDTNFEIHGFESQLNYNFSKKIKFFSSYYLQKIKNKTKNKEKDFFVPKYKFISGLMFNSKYIDGSIVFTYVPQINQVNHLDSDDYADVNINLLKSFFNDKLDISLGINNLFNNIHKEYANGLKIKRNIVFNIKYNF